MYLTPGPRADHPLGPPPTSQASRCAEASKTQCPPLKSGSVCILAFRTLFWAKGQIQASKSQHTRVEAIAHPVLLSRAPSLHTQLSPAPYPSSLEVAMVVLGLASILKPGTFVLSHLTCACNDLPVYPSYIPIQSLTLLPKANYTLSPRNRDIIFPQIQRQL